MTDEYKVDKDFNSRKFVEKEKDKFAETIKQAIVEAFHTTSLAAFGNMAKDFGQLPEEIDLTDQWKQFLQANSNFTVQLYAELLELKVNMKCAKLIDDPKKIEMLFNFKRD